MTENIFGLQTIERVHEWEQYIADYCIPYAKNRYEEDRLNLSSEQQRLIDQAISQRYIVLYDKSPRVAESLERVCIRWCEANNTPMVMIGPIRKGTNKSKTHVRFCIEWATLHGVISNRSVYTPQLPFYGLKQEDEIFHLIMMLAVEYTSSSGHLHLKCVPVDRAEDVARQIIAMYDRARQKRLEEVNRFLSGETLTV